MENIVMDVGNRKMSFQSVNSFSNLCSIDGRKAIRVIKDPKIAAVDEPTFARMLNADFRNGIIEVDVLSRLLKDAPESARGFIAVADGRAMLYLNGSKQPVFVVEDLKHGPGSSGGIGLWVDIGTEGYFADLRIEHS